MIIDGRKRLIYSDNLLIRIDPELRSAVAEAAERERTSMSEVIRRGFRAALAGPAATTLGHRVEAAK